MDRFAVDSLYNTIKLNDSLESEFNFQKLLLLLFITIEKIDTEDRIYRACSLFVAW